jgi:cupin fold WbuC family metalloprotein
MIMKRISKQATTSTHHSFSIIDKTLIDEKVKHAAQNMRLREIHAFHKGDHATLHRMLNAIQPKSYIVPHRHLKDPKEETIIILRGSLGCVCFNDDGCIIPDSICYLSSKSNQIGIDLRAGVWHTIFALEKDTVVFEVKSGPYTKSIDKEFASWAPTEQSEDKLRFLAKLEDLVREKYSLSKREWKY